jgi:Protein of unknown function (DUF3105).
MSISTGDSRHSAPKKSTTTAGGASSDTASADEPVGGVLPVKKAVRANAGRPGAGGRAGANGKGRTGASAAKANGAAKDSSDETEKSATSASATKVTSATKTTTASATKAPAKSAAAAKSASATKPKVQSALVGGQRGSALGGGKKGGRRPVTPVRVAQSRNWGPILLFVATGLVALAIVGVSIWPLIQERSKGTWQEQVAAIPGLINYIDPSSPSFDQSVTTRPHQAGDLTYPMTPPVGGPHNGYWQNCMGDVYTSEIAEEHAVHSLEHGAVWITYRPDLPQDQIDKLASRVEGREYMLMSPYPNQDSPISLQAWGYQLKVDDADDSRIDDFISALRLNASQEEGAACSGGITEATPTPLDFGEGMS